MSKNAFRAIAAAVVMSAPPMTSRRAARVRPRGGRAGVMRARAQKQLQALVEATNLPVATMTLGARGARERAAVHSVPSRHATQQCNIRGT